MSLKKYLSKRKLKQSHEPKAKIFKRKKGELQFVVQKHAASRLHYDFRLELDGVLKSWAIPKGPSLDPAIKRLAIQVEDHPYAYRTFEGVIAQGYGAGSVMIWDKGTYAVENETREQTEKLIREGLKKGAIHFTLKGNKLQGKFSLVKMKDQEWLLIKSREKEIGEKREPMLATLIDKPFDSPEWLFEVKLDGFRALAQLNKKSVALYSRNFLSFNERFPTLIDSLQKLNLEAILDGEIVVLDEKGISHFQLLQNYTTGNNLYFYVFDILYLNGKDLRALPLIERKAILKNVLKKSASIRYLEHVEKKGVQFFALCKKKGLEGIIGKKRLSVYQSGKRSREWVKIKSEQRTEVVICGFTEPKNSRKNFGALLVGIYKNRKKNRTLHFAGHVGGGFTEKELEEIKAQLSPLVTERCPFTPAPRTNSAVTWVKPHFLCEVKYQEWTSEGIMRLPIFLSMRSERVENPYITHREKLYWEEEKITKGDLLSYYETIAPFILPYLIDRPESLKRFPNGITKQSFFQKNITTYPEWLSTHPIQHRDKTVNYALIQDTKSLLYLVNLGCIELHPWLSRIHHLENPDFLLFDLDPEDINFQAVVTTAQALHAILETIQVASYCKTSGARGLHVCVPLGGRYSYAMAKQFAALIALIVHQKLPEITSLERSPKKRQKRVYIDCFQNNFGQTIIAPYSARAKPGAPVSTPLAWSEVKQGLDPLNYTIFNTLKRLKKKGDIFQPVLHKGVDLKKALKLMQKLL